MLRSPPFLHWKERPSTRTSVGTGVLILTSMKSIKPFSRRTALSRLRSRPRLDPTSLSTSGQTTKFNQYSPRTCSLCWLLTLKTSNWMFPRSIFMMLLPAHLSIWAYVSLSQRELMLRWEALSLKENCGCLWILLILTVLIRPSLLLLVQFAWLFRRTRCIVAKRSSIPFPWLFRKLLKMRPHEWLKSSSLTWLTKNSVSTWLRSSSSSHKVDSEILRIPDASTCVPITRNRFLAVINKKLKFSLAKYALILSNSVMLRQLHVPC